MRAVESGEFKPNNLYIHSYPLPVDGEPSSVEWLFVADVLNFSFWQLEEDQHYTFELKGVKYTGYMALCAALTQALEVNNVTILSIHNKSHFICLLFSLAFLLPVLSFMQILLLTTSPSEYQTQNTDSLK